MSSDIVRRASSGPNRSSREHLSDVHRRSTLDRIVIALGLVALSSLLVPGCGGTKSPVAPAANQVEPFASRPDLSLVYRVQGRLSPAVDILGLGAMKVGHAEVAGAMPTWKFGGGALTLGVTQPAGPLMNVSAGAFVTPVAFAAGTVFGMRAVFSGAAGPQATGNVWAVVLGARTGDEHDLVGETRAAATLQVRADGARLNTPGATVPANLPNVPKDVYAALLGGSTFTLELLVDRMTGAGNAVLRVGAVEVSRAFTYAVFTSTGGPTITAIGPSLAIANGPGQSASVRVLDFQIFR